VRPIGGESVFQYFSGEVVFRHRLPFDRSSLKRWRQRQIGAIQRSKTAVTRCSISRWVLTLRAASARAKGLLVARVPRSSALADIGQ
jgi:hypothetical protein